MNEEFFKEFHIASINGDKKWHSLKVNVLLQNTEAKQPSINAFLGARYSRSADSIVDIAKEIYESGKDASKKLEAIFYNYGHKSVGDMADVFLTLENIPIFVAQRFFYSNPVHAGQERSTRYQDFSKPKFVRFPDSIKVSRKVQDGYEDLMHLALKYYSDLKDETEKAFISYFKVTNDVNEKSALKARVFDTVRYFLPIGLQTSMGVLMSARAWAERISYYRASKFEIERELGELIYNLLMGTENLKNQGYIPEADGLIRHTEADTTRKASTEAILKIISKYRTSDIPFELFVSPNRDPSAELIENYSLLINPYSKLILGEDEFENVKKKVSEIIFQNHNHHHQLGNVGQSGSYLISGIADYGAIKDLIRHRSFEKFIPLFEEELDFDKEMEREAKDMFRLCDYLEIPEFQALREKYSKNMLDYYSRVKKWYKLLQKEASKDIANEYGRYVLNHGYRVFYKFYGSFDDIAYTISLRTRNGGHIAYRKLTRDWLKALNILDPIWSGFDAKLPEVIINDRHQFVDRS